MIISLARIEFNFNLTEASCLRHRRRIVIMSTGSKISIFLFVLIFDNTTSVVLGAGPFNFSVRFFVNDLWSIIVLVDLSFDLISARIRPIKVELLIAEIA